MEPTSNNNNEADERPPSAEFYQQQQQPPPHQYGTESDDVVQVVYHSNQNGSLVGVESTYLASGGGEFHFGAPEDGAEQVPAGRSTSTLPSVAEEGSTSGSGGGGACCFAATNADYAASVPTESVSSSQYNDVFAPEAASVLYEAAAVEQLHYSNATTATLYDEDQQRPTFQYNPNAIYSTINKQQRVEPTYQNSPQTEVSDTTTSTSFYTANALSQAQDQQATAAAAAAAVFSTGDSAESSTGTLQTKHSPIKELREEEARAEIEDVHRGTNLIELINNSADEETNKLNEDQNEEEKENFGKFLSRQKGGAAESGSFRHNFRKKLGVSVSSNENDLTAHRQKLLEVQEGGKKASSLEVGAGGGGDETDELANLPSKFKRTHSVSFNVGSSRSSRHSVDIRNLPSYLTHKRASIVDVAKGAMSSLIHSFGGASGGSVSSGTHRRDSSVDELEEPIFEEPIAPTLSLGQRVALVRNSGAEFGTVGWIGQLPDVDDDWIVGVIFDNMIGNCDGEHLGVRYFYARENYAMFVPLSSLTKTDNYIGRPETGTMLSRMSVSLKPGQLISIHRSSIRLQHCFLNAPHQRVGHDVRAVSNRLHCQCHNCGPCAHLTKQASRIAAPPLFGTHHAPNKKNSLAHMAVELLAHHHHHYHDEEEHEEEDPQFGDNSAHACNFVRYSCCQQSGADGHDFSADCQMVRPELLDNLIHAPRAPHRRSRPRRSRQANKQSLASQQLCQAPQIQQDQQQATLTAGTLEYSAESTIAYSSDGYQQQQQQQQQDTLKRSSPSTVARSESSYSSCSSSRLSSPGRATDDHHQQQLAQATYQQNVVSYATSQLTNNGTAYDSLNGQVMSILDQRKFIHRRESSTYRSRQSNTSDEYYYDRTKRSGFGSSLRRCLACIIGRPQRRRADERRRPKKRKLSARNRLIEYRRRQSTFVPSTLAKPQEDFASHGIILSASQDQSGAFGGGGGYESNSDYSSYSNSSRSHSPSRGDQGAGQIVAETYQQPTMLHEQQNAGAGQQLKATGQSENINYGDYTLSDNYSIYTKKDVSYSRESALTDLGYYDTWTSNSNDTLKQIVDNSINEQEPLARITDANHYEIVSPLLSQDGSHVSEQIDISSPTASIMEQEVGEELENRDDQHDDDHEKVNQMMDKLNLDNSKE